MTSILITRTESEKTTLGNSYEFHEQFQINSLRNGQGITIGNQLRRVLLNDLGGVSISAIRIPGITHEFSTIPGVREDILEILLNLKGIVCKSETKKTQFGRVKIKGKASITAGDIQLPEGLKIINPKHSIATVSSSTNIFEMELKFEYGTGYQLASKSFLDNEEDYLYLDTVFMPVTRVNFTTKQIYTEEKSSKEQLLLDVWTNGSISPTEAIESASQITINFFSQLLNNKHKIDIDKEDLKNNPLDIEPYTNIAIEELQLSVRAYNCLKKAQINTVGDLLQYSPEQLQELKNFGIKSADEVFSTLKSKLGIILQ